MGQRQVTPTEFEVPCEEWEEYGEWDDDAEDTDADDLPDYDREPT